ncbi:MAG: hypothetical protein TECD_00656 [Hyphomicrobiaceae bacterium hypho_1]
MNLAVFKLSIYFCFCMSLGVFINTLILQDSRTVTLWSNDVKKNQNSDNRLTGGDLTKFTNRNNPRFLKPEESPGLIRAVQRELRETNYYGGQLDGSISMYIRAAIMDYEAVNHLPLTGEVSEKLLRTILLGSPLETRPAYQIHVSSKAQSVVRYVQKLLKQTKFGDLLNSGRLDALTINAIKKFEIQQKLPPKGRITYNLLLRLENLARSEG